MIGAGQAWRKRMIGGRPHYGRQPANDVAGALVEAGSRSAGRRRGGAAAGQSGRVLRVEPVRDQEARSTVSRLTMGSPAVQIPRAARRSSWALEEAGWSSAGAAVAVQSRRRKSCGLPCRGRRERACVARREKLYTVRTKATAALLGPRFSHLARPGLSKVLRLPNIGLNILDF